MLKPIEAGPYMTYLPREADEAATGNATIFNVRRVCGLEATELDLIVERAEQRAATMDEQGGAGIIFDAWRRCFVQIVASIENVDGDAVALDKFANEYLVLSDIKYLVNSSKYALNLEMVDAEIKEQRLKNGSSSSHGSTLGEAKVTGEEYNTIVTTAENTDGKTKAPADGVS